MAIPTNNPFPLTGANDVANSWATSVASRSVTYLQAMIIGSIMEFAGSVGVGARVADTIRTKVVDTTLFGDDPALLMLGMVCAVVASSLYLTMATRIGLPVSTTHSIMGGVIGMGVAAVGADGVQWVGKGINDGVVSVFLAWVIAPGLSGAFASIIFLVTKYGALTRSNPVYKAFVMVPIYFGITASLLCMLLLWKGGSYKVTLSGPEIAGTIVGVGAAFGLVVIIFLMPWLYRVVMLEDWQLRFWHIPLGPLLLRRGEVPPPPADGSGVVQDFYAGRLTKEQLAARRAAQTGDSEMAAGAVTSSTAAPTTDGEKVQPEGTTITKDSSSSSHDHNEPAQPAAPPVKTIVGPRPAGPWHSGPVLFWYVKWALFRGVDQDVISSQSGGKSVISSDVEELHAHAVHYDNKTEYMYSFLQIMTAAAASFTHGANDIANAIGPYATVFQIWKDGALPAKGKADVPVWILVFGASCLIIGLWTYGYNIMRNLGNRITLQSPSRGFSMELGSAVTVILATRLSEYPFPFLSDNWQ